MEKLNEKQLRTIAKIKSQFNGEKKSDKNSYEYLVTLNKQIKKPAIITSSIIGTISSLVFGTGMSMCMAAIPGGMVLGVIIGLFGCAGMSFSYPIYKSIHRKGLKAHKKELLTLTEKLEKSNKENTVVEVE